jgi:hypothetical protein
MAKKIETHTYVLTKRFQDILDGKVIQTSVDLNKYKDFDSFLHELVRLNLISELESAEYCTAYYESAYEDTKQFRKLRLAAGKQKPKKEESNEE